MDERIFARPDALQNFLARIVAMGMDRQQASTGPQGAGERCKNAL